MYLLRVNFCATLTQTKPQRKLTAKSKRYPNLFLVECVKTSVGSEQRSEQKRKTLQQTSDDVKKIRKKEQEKEIKKFLRRYLGLSTSEIRELMKIYSKTVFTQTPQTIQNKIKFIEELLDYEDKTQLKQSLLGCFSILSASTVLISESFYYWSSVHQFKLEFLRKNLRLLSCSKTSIEDIMTALNSLGFQQPEKLLRQNPRMISMSTNSMKKSFEVMEQSIGKIKAIKLIENAPQILSTSSERLEQQIQNFTEIFESSFLMWKIVEQQPQLLIQSINKVHAMHELCVEMGSHLCEIVSKYPQFIKYNESSLREKFDFLVQLFDGSYEEVAEMVCKNPRCITGMKEGIQQRFDWFINKGFDKKQTQSIIQSCSDLLILNVETFEKNWEVLFNEGLSQKEIIYIVNKYPGSVYKNLTGETQQQKLRFFNKFAEGGSRAVLLKAPSIFSGSLKNRIALRYYLLKQQNEKSNKEQQCVQWSTLHSMSDERFCKHISWSRERFQDFVKGEWQTCVWPIMVQMIDDDQ